MCECKGVRCEGEDDRCECECVKRGGGGGGGWEEVVRCEFQVWCAM